MIPLYVYSYKICRVCVNELRRLTKVLVLTDLEYKRRTLNDNRGEELKYGKHRIAIRPGLIYVDSPVEMDVIPIVTTVLQKLQLPTRVEYVQSALGYIGKLHWGALELNYIGSLFTKAGMQAMQREKNISIYIHRKWSIYNHRYASDGFKNVVFTLLLVWRRIGLPIDILIDNIIPLITLGVIPDAKNKLSINIRSHYFAWGNPDDIAYTIALVKRIYERRYDHINIYGSDSTF